MNLNILKQLELELLELFFSHFRLKQKKKVAIKKVCLDPHFKNRELSIVVKLNHPNVLHFITYYHTTEGSHQDSFLHLVTDYVPESLSAFISSDPFPSPLYIKLFGFQIFSGLCYLHAHGVCHRDIKPPNVLVNRETGDCQLCDFGSAKFLLPGEESVSYIATRSYRAPELLLDCPSYTTAIDIWAAGCVLCELVLHGKTLFQGSSNMEVLRVISKTIGSPKPEDLTTFVHRKQYPFDFGKGAGIEEKMPKWVPPEFVDLMKHIFVYDPYKRFTAAQCMSHPFFAELFVPGKTMPNRNPLPDYLANMTSPEEMLHNYPDGPSSK